MKLAEIDTYLENKIEQNLNYIVFTFYELKVKLDLSEEETLNMLHLVRTKLKNNNYNVYWGNQEYTYKGQKKRVEDNELLVAVREQK